MGVDALRLVAIHLVEQPPRDDDHGVFGTGSDHGGAETGYRALQKLIDRDLWKEQPYPPTPGIPRERGGITIASLRDAQDPERLVNGVDRWARSAWTAYAPLHSIARQWVQQALGSGVSHR